MNEEPFQPFEATVRRSHTVEPQRTVLVIERYQGDVEVGDGIELVLGATRVNTKVVTIAWGSGLGHEAPPLTLVVSGLDTAASYADATLRALPRT